MAAAVQIETVNITINDIEIAVPKGELIVEAVKRLGLEIPIFCYHPRMKPVGMCRMCIVEVGFKQPDGTVRKMPKPQAACTLPASEGMAVYTDTEMVHRDRKGVLEFLLINHPLDCPICDRGGECPLQNNTLFYGPSTSRYVELKRHAPKAFPLSKYVTLDLERCIQCGRCVRFTEEISGDSELAFRFRGANMQPSTFELRDFESKFSGNVIEICPVGALTSAKYRFRARPWDLETKPAVCTVCSNGCNVWFDYRVGKMVRINGRTNEGVNEEWTCDKGKFGHEFYNSEDRLLTPLVREGDQLVPTDWARVYSDVIRAFANGGDKVAALGGAANSNEDVFMLNRLMTGIFGTKNLDHRFERNLVTGVGEKLGVSEVQSTIASLEDAPSMLVFGTSLADELPIVFLRVRKAWFKNGAKVVVAHHAPTDADSFAEVILRYKEGTEAAVASGLLSLLVSAGKAQVPAATADAIKPFTPEHVEQLSGVPAEKLRVAAELLEGAPIITTRSMYNQASGVDALEALAGLAMVTNGKFNCYSLQANAEGATLLGTKEGMHTHQILNAAAAGELKALWLVNVDPFALYPDRELVQQALENVEFLAVQGTVASEAMHYASVVLPQCAPAEMDGTYTNVERRVQRMRPVLKPKGSTKPGWNIFSEIAVRLRPATPFFNPGEVMAEIAKENPAFEGATYDKLPAEGFVIR
ncbi:MAG: NADH dehydrogenase (quinone) subunit G [Armatimonadetes bacterium 55-13]|nr:NADH-quinone oxidoreductase subunit NuoG [Armatimonadota bacterium]OJU63371.1 MAG: NADH dehydrogenase (quinone) subunit G [Armatimonadetes bacterium 55-13]